MKKSQKTIASIIACSTTAIALTLGVIALKHNSFSTRIEADAYHLTLNSSNGITGSNVTTTKNQSTDSGNYQVAFKYEKCSSFGGGHATLLATGKIVNTEHIRSIYNLTATFATEGALKFRTSYDGATWGGYTSMTSTENYPLGSNPYYVEFSTDGTHSVDITSIKFSYTCLENEKAKEGAIPADSYYQKVTNSTNLTNGDYLIVYESSSKVFNGGLPSLDAEGNYVTTTIKSSKIDANATVDAAKFTLTSETDGWTILSSSGKYIGRSSNNNGLETSTTKMYNSISVNSSSATIKTSSGPELKFNNATSNGDRFRYYKSGQQAVALYKYVPGAIEYDTPVDENGFEVTDANIENYTVNDIYDKNGLSVKATFTDGTKVPLSEGGENGYSFFIRHLGGETIDTSKKFDSVGMYQLVVNYKDYLPSVTNFAVGDHLTAITPALSTSTFNTADKMSEHLTGNLSAVLTTTSGSTNVTYANFAANKLSVSLLDPEDVVRPMDQVFGVAGTWKIKVTSTVDSSVYGTVDVTVNAIQVQTISFAENAMTLYVGDDAKLVPIFNPSNATNQNVVWDSSNATVASVDNQGNVHAIKKGTTDITATSAEDSNKVAICHITVKNQSTTTATISSHWWSTTGTSNIATSLDKDGFDTSNITLTNASASNYVAAEDKSSYRLGSGSNTGSITFNFAACVITGVSIEAKYFSSDNSVPVKISTSGNTTGETISVNSSSYSTFTTTAFKSDNTESTSLTIATTTSGKRAYLKTITLTIGAAEPVYPTAISLSNATINVGEATQLVPSFTPNDTNQTALYWESENTAIATVDQTGIVTGVAQGSTTITATGEDENGNDVVGSCTVTVNTVAVTGVAFSASSIDVGVGGNKTVKANVIPSNASNKTITYSSNNTSVATVNPNTGVVNGVSTGTATITATTAEGGFTATCTVNVSALDAWTLMFYVCGSNLESDPINQGGGCATSDINEILAVKNQQPGSVNIIMETGGANTWRGHGISNNNLDRYEIDSTGMTRVDQLEDACMGDEATFQSFLEWGFDNYPAERIGIFMWNHGGAMDGCCFDEKHDDQPLYNEEVDQALTAAKAHSGINDNLEFIAYDACLMAVQDIAEVNSHHFNYMLSSQESEYSGGYDYDSWLPTLYADPRHVSTVDVLTSVAHTFIEEQKQNFIDWGYSVDECDQTQSVYDLSYMAAYKTAFENLATGLSGIMDDSLWSSFSSLMKSVQQYGADNNGAYKYDIYDAEQVFDKMLANNSYNGVKGLVTTAKTAMGNVIVYEEHTAAITGCGMNIFAPLSGYNYYYDEDTNFVNWYNLCNQYTGRGK